MFVRNRHEWRPTCASRHARARKLQRFRHEWPFYAFLFYGENSGRENVKYIALNFRNLVVILLGIHQGGDSPVQWHLPMGLAIFQTIQGV